MIDINIYDMPYVCRTKELLWAHETETMFSLMINENKTIEEMLWINTSAWVRI